MLKINPQERASSIDEIFAHDFFRAAREEENDFFTVAREEENDFFRAGREEEDDNVSCLSYLLAWV